MRLPPEALIYASIATVEPPERATDEVVEAQRDVDAYARRAAGSPAALRFLHAAVLARLREYGTSADEDRALLQRSGMLTPAAAPSPTSDTARTGSPTGASSIATGGGEPEHEGLKPRDEEASALRRRCALLVRLAEKRILEAWARVLDQPQLGRDGEAQGEAVGLEAATQKTEL
jgi:hypothetical protein